MLAELKRSAVLHETHNYIHKRLLPHVTSGYVRCVQDAHPAGQSSRSNLVNLLERATRALRDDERYRNDPRYLRLWLMYAENVEDARDIFAYLEAHGIGRRLAGFYEEHALLWESYGR